MYISIPHFNSVSQHAELGSVLMTMFKNIPQRKYMYHFWCWSCFYNAPVIIFARRWGGGLTHGNLTSQNV